MFSFYAFIKYDIIQSMTGSEDIKARSSLIGRHDPHLRRLYVGNFLEYQIQHISSSTHPSGAFLFTFSPVIFFVMEK